MPNSDPTAQNDGLILGTSVFGAPETNPFGLAGVGANSSPTFVDIDNDGDLDAFIGEGFGDTFFFENTGSATNPTFAAPETNPFGLATVAGPSGVGFSNPTFADIDDDGDLDAFIGNGFGETIFFRNTGSASSPTFAAPETNPFELTVVTGTSSPAFVDIDDDGDLDAFIGDYFGNTSFFENTGSASSPSFGAPQTNPFGLARVGYASSPSFADIDGDGDLDAFIGEGYGNINFFENTGSATNPTFAAPQTNPLGLANVGFFSSPTLVDIDSDGDLDAFIGNGFGETIFFEKAPTASADPAFTTNEVTAFTTGNVLTNDSDPDGDTLTVTSIDTTGTLGIVTSNGDGTFNYDPNGAFESLNEGETATDTFTYTIDDGNGGTDTATVTITIVANTGPIARNNGLIQSTPSFAAPETNPFGLPTTDFAYTRITFADIDGDGDLDGFFGDYRSTSFLENIGSSTNPSFAAPQTNPFGLTDTEFANDPTLADIDGDGDLDLFAGSGYGDTFFFENIGDENNPSFAASQTNPFGLTAVGGRNVPSFVDIDGDGDLDAFTSVYGSNSIQFSENVGTATAPSFAAPQENPFGLTDVDYLRSPTFADIDGDGDLDIIAGEGGEGGGGDLFVFENTGSSTNPSFAAPLMNPYGLTNVRFRSSPSAADIDGDGDVDVFVKNQDGDAIFFENTTSPPSADPAFTTDEDTTLITGNVLTNDSDPNGDPLTVTNIDTTGTLGLVTSNGDGTFTYDPNGAFESLNDGETATDTFTYTIDDGNGGTDTATVTITINGVTDNTAPTDLALDVTTVNENVEANTVVGTLSTTDPDAGDTFTYALVSGTGDSDNAAFTIVGNQLKINASPNFEAKSSYNILVKTTDAGGLSYEKALTVGVNNVNEAPTVTGETVTTSQNTGNPIVNITVNVGDNLSDPDINGLTGATLAVTSTSNGTIASIDQDNRMITFTPTAGFSGTASFNYTLTDAGGLTSNVATVTVEVGGILSTGNGGQEVIGNNGNDYIAGGNGQDTLRGRPGADTLLGNNGNDILYGEAGDDILNGGNGNDILYGGLGNDTLTGGNGPDTFVLAAGEGTDTITDFNAGTDKIGLTAGLTFGALSFNGNNILVGSEVLATLTNVNTTTLTQNNFVTV